MNSNTAWLIAFIIVVIIVGVGIYFYYKQKNKANSVVRLAPLPKNISNGDKNIIFYEKNEHP